MHQGDHAAEAVYVVHGEADFRTGLGPSCLQRSAAGENPHDLHAKIGEDIVDGASKTRAIGEQQDHGGDTPGHAQHGECGTAPVVPHGRVSLSQEIVDHLFTLFSKLPPGATWPPCVPDIALPQFPPAKANPQPTPPTWVQVWGDRSLEAKAETPKPT